MTDCVTLDDCLEIADLAAVEARRYFRADVAVDFKSDESPVTIADKNIEQMVRDAILRKFPDHGILGEEFGSRDLGNENVWVVDPIDGTRSFISGFPLFGFLLAWLHRGQPKMGIVGMPMLNETYAGVVGQGATLNGKPIRVSGVTDPDRATIYINEGDKFSQTRPAVFARLMTAGSTRRLSYDCYPHALLAAGHIDAVVDYDLKPFDFLPLVPVVTAAGGVITGWKGEPLHIGYEGPVLSAATPELHFAMQRILQEEQV